jgi:hypothetical protein
MIRIYRQLSLLAMLSAVGACLAPPAGAQITTQISLDVRQLGDVSFPPSYHLRIPSLSGFAAALTVTTPDGTTFGPSPVLHIDVSTPTFAQFGEKFFGVWTILEDPNGPMQANSTYNFTFSPFTLNDVYSEIPTITTPLDGADAPSTFFLEWQFPSGATPSNRAVSYSPGGPGADVTFDPSPAPRARFDVDVAQFGAGPLHMRAGTVDQLSPYFSPVTLQSGPLRTNFVISQPDFFNFSAPISVNIVPEPQAVFLAGMAVAVIARRLQR